MVGETLTLSRMLAAGIAWPPDDTAESVVGTDLNQKTATNVRLGSTNARSLSGRLAVRSPGRRIPKLSCWAVAGLTGPSTGPCPTCSSIGVR